jgi:hypothetical protein
LTSATPIVQSTFVYRSTVIIPTYRSTVIIPTTISSSS